MLPKKLDQFLDSAQVWISYGLRFSLLISIVINALSSHWMLAFLSAVTLILTFLPAIIEKNSRLVLPIELESSIVFFIYGTIFLGEVSGYYNKFWWWDVALHFLSSLILGFVGFLIAYVLYTKKLVQAKPFLVVLFAFCFAVSLGAVWEIYEYSMDIFLKLNMQKSGLVDTMEDLITDCSGALIVSTLGYYYLKFHQGWMFKDWVLNFAKANPKLFRRRKRVSA